MTVPQDHRADVDGGESGHADLRGHSIGQYCPGQCGDRIQTSGRKSEPAQNENSEGPQCRTQDDTADELSGDHYRDARNTAGLRFADRDGGSCGDNQHGWSVVEPGLTFQGRADPCGQRYATEDREHCRGVRSSVHRAEKQSQKQRKSQCVVADHGHQSDGHDYPESSQNRRQTKGRADVLPFSAQAALREDQCQSGVTQPLGDDGIVKIEPESRLAQNDSDQQKQQQRRKSQPRPNPHPTDGHKHDQGGKEHEEVDNVHGPYPFSSWPEPGGRAGVMSLPMWRPCRGGSEVGFQHFDSKGNGVRVRCRRRKRINHGYPRMTGG